LTLVVVREILYRLCGSKALVSTDQVFEHVQGHDALLSEISGSLSPELRATLLVHGNSGFCFGLLKFRHEGVEVFLCYMFVFCAKPVFLGVCCLLCGGRVDIDQIFVYFGLLVLKFFL